MQENRERKLHVLPTKVGHPPAKMPGRVHLSLSEGNPRQRRHLPKDHIVGGERCSLKVLWKAGTITFAQRANIRNEKGKAGREETERRLVNIVSSQEIL